MRRKYFAPFRNKRSCFFTLHHPKEQFTISFCFGEASFARSLIKSRRDGTTYIIREFMVGKEQAADIAARRVIRALEPDVPMR